MLRHTEAALVLTQHLRLYQILQNGNMVKESWLDSSDVYSGVMFVLFAEVNRNDFFFFLL